jgi:cytochrome c oxidase subunit 1
MSTAAMHPAAHAPSHKTGWTKWLRTTDHKEIGIMYLVASFLFFLVGGFFALGVRGQLLTPEMKLLSPDLYNQFLTMHATSMIFLFIMPALSGFGNYAVPLQIGAKDMAFPRVNNLAFWMVPFGAMIALSSFLFGSSAAAGWTSYPPLANAIYSPGRGVDLWILSVHVLGASSIMGALNFVVTIMNMRAPGMGLFKMPIFCWTWLVTAMMQIFATPVLAGAITMLLTDRNFGTNFFAAAKGGDNVLFQHLFWFYSHPAVYIMILPAFGIISEILPAFSKKPIFGYHAMAWSTIAIGILGYIVWGHHMFSTGISAGLRTYFMVATMFIAVPTGVKIFSWCLTMWGGVLEFKVPMLFAVAFVGFFLIGGLSGIYCASLPFDLFIHDTYFVVAHIHYVLFAGSVMGILGGIYYWFPKMTGRMMDEGLGKLHFWITLTAMNVTFFPMHFLGLMGMPRRIFTYDVMYSQWNMVCSVGAFVLGFAQLIFVYNVLVSRKNGAPAGNNPWGAKTLEWTISSPPPAHNFDEIPVVH